MMLILLKIILSKGTGSMVDSAQQDLPDPLMDRLDVIKKPHQIQDNIKII